LGSYGPAAPPGIQRTLSVNLEADMDTTITTIDRAGATRVLVAAATDAALAPSIHNTQPWRWRIDGGVADLYADTRRQLSVADPDRRLLTLSCGAALNQACVALAAAGVAVDVTRLADPDDSDHSAGRMPGPADPDHLARITVTGRTPVTETAVRLYQSAEDRFTDRRPLLDEALSDEAVAALRATAGTFGIALKSLTRAQVIDLASATSQAQDGQIDDAAANTELDAWTGTHRPADAGIPDANIPDRPVPTTVPMRDFGHLGSLAVPAGHDNAATYMILYGLAEQPRSWLRAGEALSAIWLTATEHQIALLPLSAAVESPATRQRLHRILAGLGYPYLALRLGIADPNLPRMPRTPRLSAAATIDVRP
jgi:hypothetical protein